MTDDDQVRLKPFMGMRPGVYLSCIYGAALLIILFFVLLYPGISNPGSVIVVKSEPWGAAVLVDGVYMEAAPCKIFVPAGRRRIELSLPGFTTEQIDMDIGGRLFASALFPLKMEISEKLEARSPVQAFINEASEYAAWTFAGEPNAAYQIPLSLSEGVYRLGPAAANPAVRESMQNTIAAAVRFAVTRAGLRDLIRAKILLDNQGLSPSVLSLAASAEGVIGFLGENPQAALWLASTLSGEAQSGLTNSLWYAEAAAAELEPGIIAPQSGGVIQAASLNFRMINGGLLPSGGNFPAGTKLDTFYICDTVISAAAWDAFLEQQPQWEIENEDRAEAAGLPGTPGYGVSGISWHSAQAFCKWLNSALPPQFAAWEARLPTEAEWEYAARAGAFSRGNFWEWCEDPFAPISFLSAPPAAAEALGSPERSLRGGSWINPPGSVTPETRSSLPPSFCSPFVSARPVIAPRSNHL